MPHRNPQQAKMMFCVAIAIIGFLYALAQAEKMGESVNTDTGNIRYHAKLTEERL